MPSRRTLLLTSAAASLAGSLRVAAAPRAEPEPRARTVTRALAAAGTPFVIGCDGTGVTSLRYRGDGFDTDYISAGSLLGQVIARHRTTGGTWQPLDSRTGTPLYTADTLETRVSDDQLTVTSRLRLAGQEMLWSIELENHGAEPLEIGDLILPLPMHTRFVGGRPSTESVLKHSFVSGHGSHLFWMRSNSAGPYLMLLPDADTHLEYWERRRLEGEKAPDSYCAFIHAAASAAETRATGTNWRQPVSALTLRPGERRTYGFRFRWVADYAAARIAIAETGGVDVEIAPGMTLPTDLEAILALRSSSPVTRIEAEFPDHTRIEPLPDRAGRQLYRLAFRRLGENRLALHQPGGRVTHLEFFATEPQETLIAKRGAFIARHQHRDPAKWYDGLFGEWASDTGTLLGPDNYDRIKGWRIYEVTCDDPGLSKPAFLALKNAEHPVAAEVAALDRYIDKFVWGGLQRSDREKNTYGIYGIPDWKTNRESADPGPKGRDHIWRPYDYPHLIALYFGMYRVARDHPHIPTKLDADTYLRRAHGTALGMFTIPMRVTGWSAYGTGFYNECEIPELIEALAARGWTREAAELQSHWARKVRHFVQESPDLFGSEYPFDSTGFESTQALARSALDDPAAMGVTPDQARAFAEKQIAANLFCRGWLEPAYYTLGSDYRAQGADSYTLTYMAQMGGWAVLDHALHGDPTPDQRPDPADLHALLRLGYASQLSAWAILNTGTPASDYGYWFPGEANDGAAAGGFEPAPRGETWLDQPHHRGAWYYACEADLGFCGALRAARTTLADDPILGRTCHGGTWTQQGSEIAVIPRDGVRRRLSVRLADASLDLELRNARFASATPIRLEETGDRIRFTPERFAPHVPKLRLRLRAEAPGDYVLHAGSTETRLRLQAGKPAEVELAGTSDVVIRRIG